MRLDYLSTTVNSCADIAESILQDIDCDDDFDHNYLPSELLMFGRSGPNPVKRTSGENHVFCGSCHFSDIYLLIEMLSIPCLAIEVTCTFERAVAHGAFVSQSVSAGKMPCSMIECDFTGHCFLQPDVVTEGEANEQLSTPGDDFTLLLDLPETLALSKHPLQYVHHLENQIKEEMSRHVPLYGAGLEALSMKELDTISSIHEEGPRQIRAIQQCKGNQTSTPLSKDISVWPVDPDNSPKKPIVPEKNMA